MTSRLSSLPTSALDAAWNVISSLFGWSLILTVVLLSAVSMYGVFYVLYLPAPHHVKPIHFTFRTHGYRKPINSEASGKKIEYRHAGDGFPESVVHLRSEDKSSAGERILMRGQSYKVSLELVVPNSDVNRGLGMFMTELTFRSKNQVTVGTSTRSALLPYSSKLISILSSLVDFFMLHLDLKQENHMMKIVLFEDFVDDSYHPAETADIVIYCKDIQIYSAKLHIESIYTGIRYYMFYWPITSAAFGIISNISIGTVFAIWLYFKFCKRSQEEEAEEIFEIDENYTAESTADGDSVHREGNLDQTENIEAEHSNPAENEENIENRAQHASLRRLCGPQRVIRRRNRTDNQAVSLIRPSRSRQVVRTTRDEACQTEVSVSEQADVETTESEFFDAQASEF